MHACIERATEEDAEDVVALMRGYVDFYKATRSDEELRDLVRSLLTTNPTSEGLLLLARGAEESALGFASIYWTWSPLTLSRIAIMNDLYVRPDARRNGIGVALIEECRRWAHVHGAARLTWQTAKDNEDAQHLYRGIGAHRSEFVDYWIAT